MPAWIHERAEHILAKNPKMNKSQAFAVATQQSHAAGKSPKGYGTSAGKTIAKAKYDQPKKTYTKTPNPQGLKTPKLHDKPKTRWTGSKLVTKQSMAAFVDELEKHAFAVSQYSGPLGYGGFKQESYIPPFRSPTLKTAGPPSQKKKKAAAAAAFTPAGLLRASQRVGKPRATTPAGPSIAQISKPVGFGTTLPGAGKGAI